MIKRLSYILFALVMMVSCQKAYEVSKPDELIGKEKMVEIITDMMILDAAGNVSDIPLKKNKISPYQLISEKYEIDSIQLKQNLNYYNTQFDENLEIYEEVKANVEAKRKALDKTNEDLDSIQTIK